MAGNSVLQAAGQYAGFAAGGIPGFLAAKKGEDVLTPPKQPDLLTPNALSSTPTQAQASSTAINQNLQRERAAASTSSFLSTGGGQGLLDEPTTTSRVLIGA